MSQAVLTFFSVILGATIAGGTALWQAQLVTKREREARQALREQERKDRHDAFQRETMLALQDAVEGLLVLIGGAKYDPPAYWPSPQFDADLYRLDKLTSRIFDAELCSLAKQWHEAVEASVVPGEPNLVDLRQVLESTVLRGKINDRVNVLLKELF